MVVCVNNLGALSCLEMAVVVRAAVICLGNLYKCVCLCVYIDTAFVCLHPLK